MWTKVNSLFYSLNSFTVISHETLAAKSLLAKYLRLPWSTLLTFTLLVHGVLPSNETAWDAVLMEQFFLHLLWNLFTVKLFILRYNSSHCTLSFCSLFSLFYNQTQCGRDSTGERYGQIDIGFHEWFNAKLDDPALNHSMLISAWNAETPPAFRSYISRS